MRRTQAGFTLLELLISLVILAGVIMGAASLADKYTSNLRASAAAQHMSTVGQAAQAYIKDNYAAVSAVATASTPALIRVSTLSGAGYLSSGFSASNNYAQNVCVLVLQPSAGQLNAMVVAEGGTVIDDLTLGGIAGAIGAAGGGVYSSAATTFTGTMDGWSLAVGNFANANASGLNCDGTAGAVAITAGHPVMALWFAGGDVTSGFLYRNSVPGHPELNQMNTPLVMTSTQTIGAACTTTGAIAQDGTGAVISCQGGTWKSQGSSYWQDPVTNYASLPACAGGIAWQTRVVQTPTVGAGPRAYTCDGSSWRALAVDDNGNLTVAGGLTVSGNAALNGIKTVVGGNLTVGGNTTVMGSSMVDGNATVQGNQAVYGISTLDTLAGNLTVTPTATVGTACSPNGRIAQDGTGLLLSCQSGKWEKAQGSSGKITVTNIPSTYGYSRTTCKPEWPGSTQFYVDGSMNLWHSWWYGTTCSGSPIQTAYFGTFTLNLTYGGACSGKYVVWDGTYTGEYYILDPMGIIVSSDCSTTTIPITWAS